MLNAILAGVAAALFGAMAHAQPPAAPKDQDVPAPDVCLTNACSTREAAIAKPKTPAEAIRAGNAQAVRDLGGTPNQAMDAIMTRLNTRLANGETSVGELIGNIGKFADTSDGSSLAFSDGSGMTMAPGSGMNVVGSVVRRAPDGSTQAFWLTDNGGGIWMAPGYEPNPNQPGVIRMNPRG